MCVKADDGPFLFLMITEQDCFYACCFFILHERKQCMSLIKIENLTFAYDGGENVFDNATAAIDTTWRTGLIGRNGRGKTTLLKLMCGCWPYKGTIGANVRFVYFPYALPLTDAPFAVMAASIVPGAQRWQLERETALMQEQKKLLDVPYSMLSGGQRTKLMLAAMFLNEDDFLLIDEPTDHLDASGRQSVANYLKAKRGFIVVSHDRAFLNSCVDHIVSINKSNITCTRGNYTVWEENKIKADNFETGENARIQKDIGRLKQAAEKTADWADKVEMTKYATKISGLRPDRGYIGHQSAKMMQRAKSTAKRIEREIDRKETLMKNVETAHDLLLRPLEYIKPTLMRAKALSPCYGGLPVCAGVTFELARGGRLAVTGANGSGKTSLMKLICGADIAHTGELTIGGGMKISYVAQDTSDLKGSIKDYAAECGCDMPLFFAMLSKLGFTQDLFAQEMSCLSRGEKKKLLIARSLSTQAHLYIWDEPLNFIDVMSRVQIEKLICSCAPTMLFTEHDAQFIERTATEIIRLERTSYNNAG